MCLTVLSGVLCLVSVCPGSGACTPSVHMSVVAGVILFVQVVCFGSPSCCDICIDWTGKGRHARVYECLYYMEESKG